MIPILRVTVISALLLQDAACASAPRGAALADLRSQAQVYNRSTDFGNADSIARFFAPDIVVMSPQGRQPVHGREANRAVWQRRDNRWLITALTAYPFP